MSPSGNDRYLTDEYRRKIASITPIGVDPPVAEELFLRYCREMRRFLQVDTPIEVVRRAALVKTDRALHRSTEEE